MRWLVCDYGEVLSLPQPDEDRAALEGAAQWPDSGESFWNSYWAHRRPYDRGDVSASEYWSSVLDRPITRETLHRLIEVDVAGWLHPNVRSIEAVTQLRDRGLQLALFSNAPVEVAAGVEAAAWMGSFPCKFFSCNLRAVKPEPAAYQAVLEGLRAQPDQVLFVDDRPANVAGAEAVGIRAVLFESPDQLAGLVP